MEKIERCAIYIRVSTAEQQMHGKSLQAQKEFLTNYAKEHHMQIVDVYADEGKTARKELKKRKEIHRLITDVKNSEIDVILFWKMDRWFRNVSDFYKVQDILDAHHVRWIAVAEPNMNMETRDGRLNLNIMLSIGQNEVDTTSERIKFTADSMVKNGRLIFGESNMPLGYKVGLIDGEKRMVKDPKEEDMVNAVFSHYFRYRKKKQTVLYIQENYDSAFSYTRLRTMLHSEFYKGTYRGIPYCPAYLDDEQWQLLQEIKDKTIKTERSDRIYYFSGKMRCPKCGTLLAGTGCSMISNRKTGEKKTYAYYRCNKALSDHLCSFRKKISQNLIETYLLNNLEAEYQKYKLDYSVAETPKKNQEKKRTRESYLKELERLNLLFQKERISWEYYDSEYGKIQDKLKTLAPTEKKSKRNISYLDKILNSDFKEMYESLSKENRQSFWQNTIREIRLSDDSAITSIEFY
ncbi:MAG: recombinase family protein [Lachnospiraceae bacterium]|nr:recombinase family protein [Lachnospiraceae bacterium]